MRLVHLVLLTGVVATTMSEAPAAVAAQVPRTERLMLSGHGPDDAVPWIFRIDGGQRAGEEAHIPVPSNWQQQGFGAYRYGEEGAPRRPDRGTYRRQFTIPASWKGSRVRLMFDGVMTDTAVTVNGVSAGPVHQGGFYRFGFDVTSLLKAGGQANTVEVVVDEASANPDTDRAERAADYWVFGGIFRPVWLEAEPMQAIAHAAIDARADGTLTADVTLSASQDVTRVTGQVTGPDGALVGAPFATTIPAGGGGRIRLATRIADPRLWTAETPELYGLTLTLLRGDQPVHQSRERFGFRTFEVRPGKGLFLNGQRILLKGVNRHSFRPDTGRALTTKDNYDDVRLLRAMNMNAVRMSHYPPDESFLRAADELGLYVLDELSGWQHAHDTQVGRRLVREMIDRDVNHPSILFWDNGNEGGFNLALDGDYALYDPQRRRVLHPWAIHDDVDTKHYPPYADVVRRLAGANVFMPTEFMHGLFDGGGGAGLEDYWNAIAGSPRGGGGFIWVLADEGIARTDRGGAIDTFGTFAPDGIVGPRHEAEPSVATIRDLWSPVQIDAPTLDGRFAGKLDVRNGYDFTSLTGLNFAWRTLRFPTPGEAATAPTVIDRGEAKGPDIAPHARGKLALRLPPRWRAADALALTATKDGAEVWTWTWPTARLDAQVAIVQGTRAIPPVATRVDGAVRLTGGGVTATFDAATGLLASVDRGVRRLGLANGPHLAFARPREAAPPTWLPIVAGEGQLWRLPRPSLASVAEIELDITKADSWAGFALDVSADGRTWRTVYDGSRRKSDGERYVFPPQQVIALRIRHPRRADGRTAAVVAVRLGYEAGRFPATAPASVALRTGLGTDPVTGAAQAWLDAPGAGGLARVRWTLDARGVLALDYGYRLTGPYLYHGISFDAPLGEVGTVRALVDGREPVWRNRTRGGVLGVYALAGKQAGLPRPDVAGYFAGLRWATFAGAAGDWTVAAPGRRSYLRIGTRPNDHPNTTVDFPAGDISFLGAIPGMGSKFIRPEDSGPAGEPTIVDGEQHGRLVFSFGD